MRPRWLLRRVLYALCMGLTIAAALWLMHCAIAVKPERYASCHPMTSIPPLRGLAEDSLLNIGDVKALDTLPGVGEVISQRIIETRQMISGFRLPEDLMLVKGIGVKTFQKIMDALDEPLVQLCEIDEASGFFSVN